MIIHGGIMLKTFLVYDPGGEKSSEIIEARNGKRALEKFCKQHMPVHSWYVIRRTSIGWMMRTEWAQWSQYFIAVEQ